MVTIASQQLTKALTELVTALDRRVRHLERDGEVTIARDAEALKKKALKRLAELKNAGA
jgi:hypothetical protein